MIEKFKVPEKILQYDPELIARIEAGKFDEVVADLDEEIIGREASLKAKISPEKKKKTETEQSLRNRRDLMYLLGINVFAYTLTFLLGYSINPDVAKFTAPMALPLSSFVSSKVIRLLRMQDQAQDQLDKTLKEINQTITEILQELDEDND